MRNPARCAVLAAALAALAVPATAAQAKTKNVDMGVPAKSAKAFQDVGADVNAFFPARITIRAGDKVRFRPTGFHTVDVPPNGGKPCRCSHLPAPRPVSTTQTAPFLVQRPAERRLHAGTDPEQLRQDDQAQGEQARRVGPAAGSNLKPMTVKFAKKGTFKYYCDVHPGMIGRVVVKGHHAGAERQEGQEGREEAGRAALKVAKKLPSKAPAGTRCTPAARARAESSTSACCPPQVTVAVGTTLTFACRRSRDVHTATFGPGNPETEPTSYLGQIAATFEGAPVIDPKGTYPSEQPPAVASLSPTLHGNGFWNSGALDRDSASPLQPSNTVKFDAPGTYDFYCLIHPFMHGPIKVQ